jgi:hypothetical protein
MAIRVTGAFMGLVPLPASSCWELGPRRLSAQAGCRRIAARGINPGLGRLHSERGASWGILGKPVQTFPGYV